MSGESQAGGGGHSRLVAVTPSSGNHNLIRRKPDWEPQEFSLSLCSDHKRTETRSQLSLKGTRRESSKQRLSRLAKAKPEGMWTRGSQTGRGWKVLQGFPEEKRRTLGQAAINDSSRPKAPACASLLCVSLHPSETTNLVSYGVEYINA